MKTRATYIGQRLHTEMTLIGVFLVGKKQVNFSGIVGCQVGKRYWLEQKANGRFSVGRWPEEVKETDHHTKQEVQAWELAEMADRGVAYDRRERKAAARDKSVLRAVETLRPLFRGCDFWKRRAMLEEILRALGK